MCQANKIGHLVCMEEIKEHCLRGSATATKKANKIKFGGGGRVAHTIQTKYKKPVL